MPSFERKTVLPSAKLITDLALRGMASWIPTGFRWFSVDALEEDAELGKQLRAWASSIGEIKREVEIQRFNVFLSTTAGAALNELGTLLGFTHNVGESDDAYATRIATELVMDRVTPQALEALIELVSKGTVNCYVYEPAQDILFLGDASPLSGRKRFASPDYYHGGVFEVQTDGPVTGIDDYLTRSKAAGTIFWLALVMEGMVPYNDDESAAIVGGERQDFVTNSFDIIIESFGTGTDFEAVVLDLPTSLEVPFNGHTVRGAYDPLLFSNLSKNYLLTADMLASASSGTPVYTVVETDPFSVWDPTDVQAFPNIQWRVLLGDPEDLGDPGIIFG